MIDGIIDWLIAWLMNNISPKILKLDMWTFHNNSLYLRYVGINWLIDWLIDRVIADQYLAQNTGRLLKIKIYFDSLKMREKTSVILVSLLLSPFEGTLIEDLILIGKPQFKLQAQ